MDMPEDPQNIRRAMELIESYHIPDELKAHTMINIDKNHRLSYGSWSQDRITAFDITVNGPYAKHLMNTYQHYKSVL